MTETNYFKELNSIKCVTETKNRLTYVSWSDAWVEVKKLYPESTYTIYENIDGNAFWETKFGIDVKVGVTIKGLEHIVRLPVMDGANKAQTSEKQEYMVKQNVYEGGKQVYKDGRPLKEDVLKTIEPATAFDINKTIQRAFTKAIAMHGLGLYVYRGEDLPEEIVDNSKTDNTKTESGKKPITQDIINTMKKALTDKTATVEQVKKSLDKYEIKDMKKALDYLNIQ